MCVCIYICIHIYIYIHSFNFAQNYLRFIMEYLDFESQDSPVCTWVLFRSAQEWNILF